MPLMPAPLARFNGRQVFHQPRAAAAHEPLQDDAEWPWFRMLMQYQLFSTTLAPFAAILAVFALGGWRNALWLSALYGFLLLDHAMNSPRRRNNRI